MKFKLLRSVVSALLVSTRNIGTMEYMRVKKLTDLATIPVRGTEFAAGKILKDSMTVNHTFQVLI